MNNVITERIEGNPYTAISKHNLGYCDTVVQRLPELHGLILYADIRNKLTQTVERAKLKTIIAMSDFVDFDRDDYGLEPHKYDFILSLNVLERLTNPRHYLDQLSVALRYDGRMILTTTMAWGPRKWTWNDRHFNEFDEKRLQSLLGLCYLKPVVMEKIRQSLWRGYDMKWLVGQWWYIEAKKV